MTAPPPTAPRRASAAASRPAPGPRSAPTAGGRPATAATAPTSAAGMCRPAPTAVGGGLAAPTAQPSEDQQNREVEALTHQGTQDLAAGTDYQDPGAGSRVFLLVL